MALRRQLADHAMQGTVARYPVQLAREHPTSDHRPRSNGATSNYTTSFLPRLPAHYAGRLYPFTMAQAFRPEHGHSNAFTSTRNGTAVSTFGPVFVAVLRPAGESDIGTRPFGGS